MRRRCETPSLHHDTLYICDLWKLVLLLPTTGKHISETDMKDVDQGCDGQVHCPKKNLIPSQRNVCHTS